MRRVVVTGLGVVSCLGNNQEELTIIVDSNKDNDILFTWDL